MIAGLGDSHRQELCQSSKLWQSYGASNLTGRTSVQQINTQIQGSGKGNPCEIGDLQ